MKLACVIGATPLDSNEIDGLIPDLQLQSQLNDFEKQSIMEARRWALRSRKLKQQLLTVSGLLLLHRRMFDGVWKWAGTIRSTEKNLGRPPHLIPSELSSLCDDVKYQIEHRVFDWPELAVRFHHRLVSVHPFPNGNGRHARLAADLLLAYNRLPSLHWGANDLAEEGETRASYIAALKEADNGNYLPLIKFAGGVELADHSAKATRNL